MTTNPNIKLFFISLPFRIAALCLVVFCFTKAWDNTFVYRGQSAFEKHDYASAVRFFEKGDLQDPSLLWKLGQALWKEAEKKPGTETLEKARQVFEALTEKIPVFGKGWLYLALTETALQERSDKVMTEKQWKKIRKHTRKALALEPHGAWMSYTAATLVLSQQELMTLKQRDEALELLRKSILAHDPSQPPAYLEPALDFLWKHYQSLPMLETVTPRNEQGYGILIKFLEKKGLWEYREEISGKYLSLKNYEIAAKVGEGKKLLTEGDTRGALKLFEEASWFDRQNQQQSLTGLLAAQSVLRELPQDTEQRLSKILKNDEKNNDFFLPYLRNAVEVANDPFLKGVYLYSQKDFENALKEFLEVKQPGERLDYYKLVTYLQMSQLDKAQAIAEKKLDETRPDPRALFAVISMKAVKDKIPAKLESLLTAAGEIWKDQAGNPASKLQSRARLQMPVCLKPGLGKLLLRLRSQPSSEDYYAYVIVRLWDEENEKIVAEKYVGDEEWQDYEVPFFTSGGNRTLEIELYNGTEPGKAPENFKGPELEAGTLKVVYS